MSAAHAHKQRTAVKVAMLCSALHVTQVRSILHLRAHTVVIYSFAFCNFNTCGRHITSRQERQVKVSLTLT